jgi:cytochrome c oxidase assembly protein subunit 15
MSRLTNHPSDADYSVWRNRFAWLTVGATIFLIVVGSSVTSRGVGLAVPDWPTTYGYNLFLFPFSQWIGGIFYEHVHRLVASAVGLLTVILWFWLLGRPVRRWMRLGALVLLLGAVALRYTRPISPGSMLMWAGIAGVLAGASFFWPSAAPAPRWARRLGMLAVFAVIIQGVLGGLRVTLFKAEIGMVHAALAQLFLVLVGALALLTTRRWLRPGVRGSSEAAGSGWLGAAVAVIFLQLLLGAAMRHQHAGLAIPDFPLAYGRVLPPLDAPAIERINQHRIDARDFNPITRGQIILHFTHRVTAVAVLVLVGFCVAGLGRSYGSQHLLAKAGKAWFALVLCQALLGAATVWSNKSADIASAHVLGGALTLLLGSMLFVLARWRAETLTSGAANQNLIVNQPEPSSNPSCVISG